MLSSITETVECKGKTPEQTLSRTIQDLIKLGLLTRKSRGIYIIEPVDDGLDILKASNMSKGEALVARILDELCIEYTREKTFPDLKDKSFLRYDFYFTIRGMKIAIEFDGLQHFEPIEYFGGNDAFLDRVKKDKIKTNYCIDNNITLLRFNSLNYKTIKNKIKKSIS